MNFRGTVLEEGYLKRLVVALGGNAILQFNERGTVQEQVSNLQRTCCHLAPIIASWYQVVITHGNGPQVGNILIQNERTKDEVPPMPLDVCGAQSQGQIGYLLQQVLSNELKRIGKGTGTSVVLTMVAVDPDDPAFENPSKPVGPWYAREGMLAAKKEGETWIQDPQKGWRRVVPSPRPVRIVNARSIEASLNYGLVVIACGGGGVPVVEDKNGLLQGGEAVIDKDLASECLATAIRAQILLILTDVPAVCLDYGTPQEKPIGPIHVREMRGLFERGLFPPGNIGPKVEAAIRFVEHGGERAIIASLESAEEALKGKAGTIIVGE